MQIKWLTFWLIVVGIVAFFNALRRADRADFDSGDFLWVMLEGVGGFLAIVSGILIALFLLMFE
jgi:cytochrome b subunit of formate dehydrogenase